ncbi:hypothetical protein BD410DRAFT_596751 [Rickenella mellea]|uniref:Uncharacterized protein n=1 Tax=Rickenella mellea TaxID=50990 RepID=A0A4Y7QE51_9AGAM|nr:hypothetical protein BD410DRAFT_596751 [Rickenella mellea]
MERQLGTKSTSTMHERPRARSRSRYLRRSSHTIDSRRTNRHPRPTMHEARPRERRRRREGQRIPLFRLDPLQHPKITLKHQKAPGVQTITHPAPQGILDLIFPELDERWPLSFYHRAVTTLGRTKNRRSTFGHSSFRQDPGMLPDGNTTQMNHLQPSHFPRSLQVWYTLQ